MKKLFNAIFGGMFKKKEYILKKELPKEYGNTLVECDGVVHIGGLTSVVIM